MDHLQVSVLALRETIDRQEHRIIDLEMQRTALWFVVAALAICVVAMHVVCYQ